jgi:acetate kinase
MEKLLYKAVGSAGCVGRFGRHAHAARQHRAGCPAGHRLFTYRVVRESGALVACLGGLDVLAFTGGIGEHDAALRADVGAALAYLGVRIDAAANQAADGCAGRAHPRQPTALVEVWVVPTDEGLVAARDALALA